MQFDLRTHTHLLVTGGSRAYGMHKSTSDVDVKGICVPPKDAYFGNLRRFDQMDKPIPLMLTFLDFPDDNLDPDWLVGSNLRFLLTGQVRDQKQALKMAQEKVATLSDKGFTLFTPEEREAIRAQKLEGTVFNLQKFIGLATEANPNIWDVLFCRDEEVRLITPIGRKLRENRHLFKSGRARFSFAGYAHAQLKRIRGHREYLLHPPDHQPTRAEFDLPENTLIPADHLAAVRAAVQKKIDLWEFNFTGMASADIIRVENQVMEHLTEIYVALGYPSLDDAKWMAAARSIGLNDNLIFVMQKEREYEAAARRWRQYQEWMTNRNEARAALEAEHGYDCYLDDTEFLTEAGWKKYCDVTPEDRLATVYVGKSDTVHKWGTVEYQPYTERFEGSFTGNLYHFTGTHTNTMVTPNHRMFYRPVERNTRVRHDWMLDEAASLPNCFEVLRTVTPIMKTNGTGKFFEGLPIPDRVYMTLMGWFLSEGSFSFDDSGRIKALSITQKKGGRLAWSMARFQGDHGEAVRSSLYEYEREPDEYHKEKWQHILLNVRHPDLIQRLYADCGHYKEKRIPRWVFKLSKRLMGRLLDAMMGGDGTVRGTNLKSLIYYTSLSGLADDVQELALLCGWETSKWGPYPYTTPNGVTGEMWHIHVNKVVTQFKEMSRLKNIERVPAEGARIVCFTVPNGTLVTRRNGNVSFHGNSKHGAHLVRLLKMCREILTTGEVNVWRGGRDADELLAIRNGAWTYEQVVEWAEKEDAELEALYRSGKYVIPKEPDREAIDRLCVELIEEALR